MLTTHTGQIRYAREPDTLPFLRQPSNHGPANRVMRFPQLLYFTLFY